MTYQVLARKWRPQTFDAVVGQDAVTRTLRNALASGRIAHAYLFAGPRGVGKTTTARLLAKALLCPARTGPEACGRCEVCHAVQAGRAMDLVEIDAASNRGIDEIRALRDNVKYAPARGRYKVYIIDEVHQLTAHAFDALLKTLEEPPAHVVFVLATTEPREVPPTVLSRVQRFDFRPLAPEVLSRSLEAILVAEGIPFEAEALPLVVRAAEGSLRDALSLLDAAIAYGEGRLERARVSELLGATAPAHIHALCAALLHHETVSALEAIDRAVAAGEDLGALLREVVETLRRVLVLKAAPSLQPADLSPAETATLRELGAAVTLDEILYVLRALLGADALMRDSPHPRVEFEVAVIQATRRPVPHAVEELLRRIEETQARLTQLPGAAAAPAGVQESLLTSPAEPSPSPAPPPETPGRAQPSRAAPGPDRRPSGTDAAPGDLGAAWQRVVDEVMLRRPVLGAVLAQAQPLGLRGGELAIAVAGNHFHRDLLADRAHRDLVLAAVRRWVAGAEGFTVTELADAVEATGHPAVQAALAEFEGEVVAVRPRPREGGGQ
jgi:DNA polymerase-3 subunit gamma/tau